MSDEKQNPRSRRRFYAAAFLVAFAIDLIIGLINSGVYRPSLVGLAIMITSALFFTYSLIRDR